MGPPPEWGLYNDASNLCAAEAVANILRDHRIYVWQTPNNRENFLAAPQGAFAKGLPLVAFVCSAPSGGRVGTERG